MRRDRASTIVRLLCLVLGLAGLALAAHLTRIGAAGIEDIPPPFTLVAGLAGIAFLAIALLGRCPRPTS